MLGKIILFFGVLLLLIMGVFFYFGVFSPGGSCPTSMRLFTPDLKEKYDTSPLDDCGTYIYRREGKESQVYDCLQQSLEECKPSKGYISIQGFEQRFEYFFLIDNDCKVTITRGGCGSSKDTCNKLVPLNNMHSTLFDKVCNE